MKTHCFKAYDIRGRIPDELDAALACRIAYAYAKVFQPKTVVVGRDIRLSSTEIAKAVMMGLGLAQVKVYDIGVCGTENVYFTTAHQGLSGGIMVTASHNPMDYNGLKLVREDARPVGQDTGLLDIQRLVEEDGFVLPASTAQDGHGIDFDPWPDYIQHLLGYIDYDQLRPLKILVNPGNGGAGLVIKRLRKILPCQLLEMDSEPDGRFPHGVPNPLLPEKQLRTAKRVRLENVDMGVAWDGDFDRCFLFDENGQFINGYYLVGLIASELLKNAPGEVVVHDCRLTWNTIEQVHQAGGQTVKSRTGHSFIKQVMREHRAVYGGEMSGHHYFRRFFYCDSGMIPWLLVLELMSRSQKPLSTLVSQYQNKYPAIDEVSMRVSDPKLVMEQIEKQYLADALVIDRTDGISLEYTDWRFNIRSSNTEPLLRLNIESRQDKVHLHQQLDLLMQSIRPFVMPSEQGVCPGFKQK